jgi:hypothetical protein
MDKPTRSPPSPNRQLAGRRQACGYRGSDRHRQAVRRVVPTEQHFPVAMIGLHGLLAVTTLVLLLLTALRVGD